MMLVTGASGFLGRVVCAELLARGRPVAALVRTPGSEPPGPEAVVGHLTDAAAITAAVRSAAPDCVIHLAAEKARPGTRFHCADDRAVMQYEFVARTAHELGVGAPRRSPVWLARLVTGSGPCDGRGAVGAHVQRQAQAGARPDAALPDDRDRYPGGLGGDRVPVGFALRRQALRLIAETPAPPA